MASPDFRQYVDLSLYDRQPRDIYEDAIDYAKTVLPELTVRTGTLEDALLQSMAYVSGELIASINRLPNGLMEGILSLMGLPRTEATYATGTATFTLIDSNGATLAAGTQIGYTETVEGLSTFHTFRTVTAVTIPAGSTTSTAVDIIADSAGTKPSLLSGQQMVVVSASNRILSASLASNLVTGVAAESDAEYFARGATYLASLSACLTTAEQIQNYILTNYPDVHRCKVYDLTKITQVDGLSALNRSSDVVTASTNGTDTVATGDILYVVGSSPSTFNGTFVASSTGASSILWSNAGSNGSATVTGSLYHLDSIDTDVADEPGYVSIFLGDEDGNPISTATTAEILADVEDRTVAGVVLGALPPIVVPITATVVIKTEPAFSTLTVANAVDAYLTDLLSPANWDWSSRIRVNQVVARITGITGVDYVSSLAFELDPSVNGEYATIDDPSGDILMVYKGSLPLATVTVSEES